MNTTANGKMVSRIMKDVSQNEIERISEKTNYLIYHLNKVFHKLPEFIKTIVDHLFNHSELDLKYFKQQYDLKVKRKKESLFKEFYLLRNMLIFL